MNILSQEDGLKILKAARTYVEYAVRKFDPAMNVSNLLPADGVFNEKRGVFVTLTKNKELRGCIGYPYPELELKNAVREAAFGAALFDPRFSSVKEDELESITVEVTVLTQPEVLECEPALRPDNIEIGKHGLIAEMNGKSGLLLPQVAVEYNMRPFVFLAQTCTKAGLMYNAWTEKKCIIKTFEGQIFKENEQ